MIDLLASANWQRGAKASTPRPRPIPRPGDKAPKTSLTPAERDARLRDFARRHGQRRGA